MSLFLSNFHQEVLWEMGNIGSGSAITSMSNKVVVNVGISDLQTVTAPDVIRTSGLGSCVGVVVYDIQKNVAGLAHIMLPDSNMTKEKKFNPYKYANIALPILVGHVLEIGGRKFALQAKLAGGAHMFQFSPNSDKMRIGYRNIKVVKEMLKQYNIPIVATDVGGGNGRTIEFDPCTGKLGIRTVNKGEIYI